MKKKQKLIVISGGSGVGKTTAFNNLIERRQRGELNFTVPLKVTTRPHRPSDNPLEIESISNEKYEELERSKQFCIQFARHGHRYGVLSVEKKFDEVLLQIIPARDVIPLKDQDNQKYEYIIVILNADPAIINKRRELRGDTLSKEEEISRSKTSTNKPLDQADFVIDANQSEIDVSDALAEIIKNVSSLHIKRDDLTKEIEIASAICERAKNAKIRHFLFGGIAANIYGSNREITDLDMLVDSSSFSWLTENYHHPDLIVGEKKIHIGRVEVCKTPSRVGDRSLGQVWNFDGDTRINHVNINNYNFPVISVEDLIVMKAGLGRAESEGKFDLFDIENIVEHLGSDAINFEYVISKSKRCNSFDRATNSLRSLGILSNKAL